MVHCDNQEKLGLLFHLVVQWGLVDQVLPRALLLLVVEASL